MEESATDHDKKNGKRSRKKLLYNSILNQVEFYFSNSNLTKDRYLSKILNEDGCVPVSTLLSFNKLRTLCNDANTLVKALRKSKLVLVSEDGLTISRTEPVQLKENTDECTIYVENVPESFDHETLKNIFSKYGQVDYVSIPKYKNGKSKSFAFVEFEDEESAKKAIKAYKKINCYLQIDMKPENLSSISNFVEENNQVCHKNKFFKNNSDISETEIDVEEEVVKQNSVKKRKFSEEDKFDKDVKKVKIVEEEGEESGVIENEDDNNEKNRNTENEEQDFSNAEDELKEKKKRRKRKKKNEKKQNEVEFKILSKQDWKKLRNSYLNKQRKKMKQLKQCFVKMKDKESNALVNDNNEDNNLKEKHGARKKDKRKMEKSDQTENKMEDEDATTEKRQEIKPLEVAKGSIVKMILNEPVIEVKDFKNKYKSNNSIKYIEVKQGNFEVYFRFNNSEDATSFSEDASNKCHVLTGLEEDEYINKINADRVNKFNKTKIERKKIRGKTKILQKAEKLLSRHVFFDDNSNDE